MAKNKTKRAISEEDKPKPDARSMAEIDQQYQASPTVWVPLSIMTALLLAVGNLTVSFISKYRFKARYMQSPGALIGNSLALIIVSYRDKKKASSQIDPKTGKKVEVSYFKWFNDAYYRKVETKDGGSSCYRLYWPTIIVSIFLGMQSSIQRYLLASGYHYGSLANINNGVLTSIYSMKSIFSSIIFFMVFGQSLKRFELFGIFMCVISTLSITLSNLDFEEGSFLDAKNLYSYLSLTFMFGSLILVLSRKVLTKYFFAFGDNQLNAPAVSCFRNVVFDVFFLSSFIYELCHGFEVSWLDLTMGITGGLIFSLFTYIVSYIDSWSKVGVADALLETCVIYQTAFDMLLFDRVPNSRQIFGLVVGLLATFLMIFSALYTKDDKKIDKDSKVEKKEKIE
jgi:hypothetical protein